jgi:DNA-binding transcriptional LysR family regulator
MAIRRRRRLAPVCPRVRQPLQRLPPAAVTRLRARLMPRRSFEVSRQTLPKRPPRSQIHYLPLTPGFFVGIERGSVYRALESAGKALTSRVHRAAIQGVGLAQVPSPVARAPIADGRLRALLTPFRHHATSRQNNCADGPQAPRRRRVVI